MFVIRGVFMYFMVVADIRNSKEINERIKVQNKLNDYLDKLNDEYSSLIFKNISVTLGDEFQGVFFSFEKVLEIITKISMHMNPINIRYGIGYGGLIFDNAISKDDPFKSDGEAWWNARESIEELKGFEKINKIEVKRNVSFKSNNEFLDKSVNTILDLMTVIKNGWTKVQFETIEYLVNNYGFTLDFVQKRAAKALGVKANTINDRLERSKYINYVKAVLTINDIIGGVLK